MEVAHVFKKRRLAAAGALVGLALLAMGAVRVNHEFREQPQRCFQQVRQWQDWSLVALTAVPGGESAEWQNAAGQAPLVMLQACCREQRSK